LPGISPKRPASGESASVSRRPKTQDAGYCATNRPRPQLRWYRRRPGGCQAGVHARRAEGEDAYGKAGKMPALHSDYER
jgi:hypothetical protein